MGNKSILIAIAAKFTPTDTKHQASCSRASVRASSSDLHNLRQFDPTVESNLQEAADVARVNCVKFYTFLTTVSKLCVRRYAHSIPFRNKKE